MTKKVEEFDQNTDKTLFGFWLYLMTDLALFATLFATFAVLRSSVAHGPSGKDITDLPYVLTETMILLISSFTAGLALLSAKAKNKNNTLVFLAITFALGLAFIGMELNEFHHLYVEGNSWRESGFLSAFFTLVGTHGLHISAGLIWLGVMMASIYKKGLKGSIFKRLMMFSLFWHFLDIVWIFIFTIVYLMGVIS